MHMNPTTRFQLQFFKSVNRSFPFRKNISKGSFAPKANAYITALDIMIYLKSQLSREAKLNLVQERGSSK